MKLGEYMRNMRMQNGYSLRDVVQKSKGMLDKTTISRIEKNSRTPSLRAVYALSKIYRVKMDDVAEIALGKKTIAGPPPFSISAGEKLMVENYRRLSKKEKLLISDLAAALATRTDSCGMNMATSASNILETFPCPAHEELEQPRA